MKRVSLLPHRNDWTELQHDAVTMLEGHIANRGSWRPGGVGRTPLTRSAARCAFGVLAGQLPRLEAIATQR